MIEIKNAIRDKKKQSIHEFEISSQIKSTSQTTMQFESIFMKTTISILIFQTFIFVAKIIKSIDFFMMNEKTLKKKLKKIEQKRKRTTLTQRLL